ncbi:hypothetical protein ACVWWI_004356 [Bradyrhizobium sp. USDA 3686]|uniref:hypothetical protein n=1 Tax=Bradyrhizobium TaxID=374 RepID=UPI001957F59D|nr:hypothetical protein [Bradyrhizobium canariense]MBM7482333.1 hypothetical protein [Bradyrhizobium canariense]UFW69518.1 hypothetical protein BcanWU425_22480 [Bradyrhizobium canariense]
MTSKADWPDPNWHIGQLDHLHALGVITSAYNQLEFVLLTFFAKYVVTDPEAAQKIFGLLSNYNTCDLIREAAQTKEEDETARESVLHFLKGFEVLEWNRNFLAHSHSILNNPEQSHLTFGKGSRSKPNVWSFVHLSLPEIRAIADSIRDYWSFGSGLNLWLIGRGTLIFPGGRKETVVLPDRPPLPEKLNTVSRRAPEQQA